MKIKVLGPGCPNCQNVEKIARKAVSSMGLDATIEKVTDIKDITKYPVLATPGLVINEKVVCSGRVPGEAEVSTWLASADLRERGANPMAETRDREGIVTKVRERYARIAELGDCGCSCGTTAEGATPESVARRIGYDDQALSLAPEGANLGLGCGAPVGFLDLRAGETVVDLGSGAGFDAFLAAREVGPTGRVIGVDMTPAMLERARANAAKAGFSQVEFREGRLEALPVETASADAVTSNCVINLAPNKAVVFREAARVLRPGGRMVVSDIILDGDLPQVVREDVEAYVGCIAGAMRREPYFAAIEAAGFRGAEMLKDVDYIAALGEDALPDELLRKMRGSGLGMSDLAGKIRSVTYRAIRR